MFWVIPVAAKNDFKQSRCEKYTFRTCTGLRQMRSGSNTFARRVARLKSCGLRRRGCNAVDDQIGIGPSAATRHRCSPSTR